MATTSLNRSSTRIIAIACLLLLVGCAPSPTSQQPATLAPSPSVTSGFLLPTIPAALETDPICAGVGMSPLTLRGALRDEAAGVWVETQGPDVAVLWPRGYHARFEPDLVVANPTGAEVARDGEDMSVGSLPGVQIYPTPRGFEVVVYVLLVPSPR